MFNRLNKRLQAGFAKLEAEPYVTHKKCMEAFSCGSGWAKFVMFLLVRGPDLTVKYSYTENGTEALTFFRFELPKEIKKTKAYEQRVYKRV